MEYCNFDIWVDPAEGTDPDRRYRIWASSELGEAPRLVVSMDLSSPALQADLRRLDDAKTDRNLLIRLGTGLFQSLFRGDVGRLFRLTVDDAEIDPDRGVRVRLRFSPPEISSLPWKLLYAPDAAFFLSTDIASPLVRYIELMARVPRIEARRPLRLLVAIPHAYPPLQPVCVEQEKHDIEDALRPLRKWVEVCYLEGDVTLDRVRAKLAENVFHCFHFIGHGGFRDHRGHLIFNATRDSEGAGGEDRGATVAANARATDADAGSGANVRVDEREFAALFNKHPTMKLVVLNACRGAKASSVKPLAGTAAKLVEAGIPAVIAMQFSLLDCAGVLFASSFYRELFRGPYRGRVDAATALARAALGQEMPGEREMVTPVLFMRAPDGLLFNPVTGIRLRDLAWSRPRMQTEKVVDQAHGHNLELLANEQSARPDDLELLDELVRERAEHAALKRRIRLRNTLVLCAVLVVALLFAFSVVRLFDLLGLDTKVATWTMMLGGLVTAQPLSRELALVVIGRDDRNAADKTFEQDPQSWREDHAELIPKLALGHAKAILFGVHFDRIDSQSPADCALVDAVRAAGEAGSAVVLPTSEVEAGELALPPPLARAAADVGVACFTQKLGVAFAAPLLVEKSGGALLPSVVLAAFAASRNALPEQGTGARFQLDDGDLVLGVRRGADPRLEIGFSDLTAIRPRPWSAALNRLWGAAQSKSCQAIGTGDRLANLIVAPSSVLDLRDSTRRHSYNEVLAIDSDAELQRRFSNRIVIVGVESATQAQSVALFGAPRWGFEVAADALNTLLRDVRIRSLPMVGQLLIMLVLGFIGAFLRYWLPDPRIRTRRVVLVVLTGAYLAATLVVFATHALLLNTLYHIGTLWLAYWTAKKVQRRWFF